MRQTGFTYLAVLFLVAVMGVALAAAGEVWHTVQQREKERQLLFVGDQFRQAIGLYYERTPGAVKRYPKSLNDLLKDNRYVTMQRYLRKIYPDPMSNSVDWGLVKAPEGGIMGIYSRSGRAPLKVADFPPADKDFAGALSYRDWKFIYLPQQPAPGAAAARTAPADTPKPSLPGPSTSPARS